MLPSHAAPVRCGKNKAYVDGFPALAAFIASDRDRTTAIFKRFDRLAARNLLYLQSQLAALEEQLDASDEADRGSRESLQSLRSLKHYQERPDRMELLDRIKTTVREYSEFIISQAKFDVLIL